MNPIPRTAAIKYSSLQRIRHRLQAELRKFRMDWVVLVANKLSVIGFFLLLFFFLMLVAYPILMKIVWSYNIYNPATGFDLNVMNPAPPSFAHILGTDVQGHDILSMLLFSTGHTFMVGIFAALTSLVVGTCMGAISGFYANKCPGILLMNVSGGILLLPAPLILIIIGVSSYGISPILFGVLYGLIVGLSSMALVLRDLTISILAKPFVEAARVCGGSNRHIIFKHVIPHLLPLASLYMMFTVSGAVVADGFIAFFGYTTTDKLSWGQMIYNGFNFTDAFGLPPQWNVLVPPAICLSLFAASFYLIALGIQQITNPSLRE
jgi:peptide/nickel transport system permease protein